MKTVMILVFVSLLLVSAVHSSQLKALEIP